MAKLKIHTINQPETDITAFILSCNRLNLLKRTIESFLATRDLLTKIVIVDDSGNEGVFQYLLENYGSFADIICFPKNRGLWWAKDFMVSFCDTPYIFYIEEDWLFLNSGYLKKSKNILETHRHIGSIDLSWRTFEEEGIDSYYPELIEGEYYLKKPWRISDEHLPWFCWQGSPNLKRREDLLLLGRVEGFYTEWNIDRKFYALGFRGVYLKDKYVYHLGDHQSLMVNKRPTEWATPELLYPKELLPYRIYPSLDYYKMSELAVIEDSSLLKRNKTCFVTCLLDINRKQYDNRGFSHYLDGIQKLLELDYPLVIFCDWNYYEKLLSLIGGKRVFVIPITIDLIRKQEYYQKISKICQSESWQNQAEWMKNSIIKSPDYISLTLHKMAFLKECADNKIFKSEKYYWIDSGICNSFGINSLVNYNFDCFPDDNRIFMTRFPYYIESEMHGYSKEGFEKLCGKIPNFVCRATLFGGTKKAIFDLNEKFKDFLIKSLDNQYIGTEEALFSGISITNPELFNLFDMPNGGINNYLESISKEQF
jgi:hypothetical protein